MPIDQVEKVRELLDQIQETRMEIVDAEIQLANVGAKIYKCRDETRKIRTSLPSKEYLERVRQRLPRLSEEETTRTLETLTKKKARIEASLAKVREKTFCHLQKTCPRPKRDISTIMSYLLLTMLLIGVSFVIGKSLVGHPKE